MRQGPILLRGGGDLASGVALRLHRAGFDIVICELAQPLAVRRTVAFAEAVYSGTHQVEEVLSRHVEPNGIPGSLAAGEIPVLVDPQMKVLTKIMGWLAVVDARMIKAIPDPLPVSVPLHIGLGPGFVAGQNCDAVVETRRSHTLGRVIREGAPQPDSGIPEGDPKRVLRAPIQGKLQPLANIGDHLEGGQNVAVMRAEDGVEMDVISPLAGVLRGLIHEGVMVPKRMKIGDVDPRDDPAACFLVSDKALAVGGGVMEAILAFQRRHP